MHAELAQAAAPFTPVFILASIAAFHPLFGHFTGSANLDPGGKRILLSRNSRKIDYTRPMKIASHDIYTHPLPADHRFPMLKYELDTRPAKQEGLSPRGSYSLPDRLQKKTILLTHTATYWHKLRDQTLEPWNSGK